MSRIISTLCGAALAALAACAASEATETVPAPSTTAATAADPAAVARPAEASLATLAALAKDGPTTTQFPQADAYVALERHDLELRADHTVVEHVHTIVRILDAQRGKAKYADVHVPFDQRRQTLVVETARTVTPDGAAHVASDDEIGDIVPPELADATTYSDVRERVVSFPAVDTGAVVELAYTRTTRATPDAPLGGEILLGAWDPVKSFVVTIATPDGVAPRLAVANATLEPVRTGRVATYTLADLPDHHTETGSPPEQSILPRLVYGFSADWAAATRPIAERFVAAAVPSPLPAAVVAKAAAIVAAARATDDDAVARALFGFVTHDVRSVELPLGAAGYEPHPPDVVLANRYADGRDKVGLLLALAAAQHISGKAVFVRSQHVQVAASVPTVAQFDHVVAVLTVRGKEVWLDPLDDGGQYGVAPVGQDNLVLPVTRTGELGRRPALDPTTSTSRTTATLVLAGNGDLDATFRYELAGTYAMTAIDALRPLRGETLDRYFQSGAARVADDAIDVSHAASDTTSVAGPFAVTQHVTAPAYAQPQGTYRVVELPEATFAPASDDPEVGLSVRTYPLFVGSPRTEVEDLTLAVPAGWNVAYVPPPIEGSADGVRYRDRCEARGQTVTCHTEVVLDRIEVPVASYPGVRDAFAKLTAYERRIVLLVRR